MTANAGQRHLFGNRNSLLTYTLGGLIDGDTPDSIGLTGALTATARGIGNYAINQGSLSNTIGYAISYTGNTLAVIPAIYEQPNAKPLIAAAPSDLNLQIAEQMWTVETPITIIPGTLSAPPYILEASTVLCVNVTDERQSSCGNILLKGVRASR